MWAYLSSFLIKIPADPTHSGAIVLYILLPAAIDNTDPAVPMLEYTNSTGESDLKMLVHAEVVRKSEPEI